MPLSVDTELGEALFAACGKNGSAEAVQELLARGASPKSKCGALDRTPLHAATNLGRSHTVECLLNHPDGAAALETVDAAGYTVIHDAALNRPDALGIILDRALSDPEAARRLIQQKNNRHRPRHLPPDPSPQSPGRTHEIHTQAKVRLRVRAGEGQRIGGGAAPPRVRGAQDPALSRAPRRRVSEGRHATRARVAEGAERAAARGAQRALARAERRARAEGRGAKSRSDESQTGDARVPDQHEAGIDGAGSRDDDAGRRLYNDVDCLRPPLSAVLCRPGERRSGPPALPCWPALAERGAPPDSRVSVCDRLDLERRRRRSAGGGAR